MSYFLLSIVNGYANETLTSNVGKTNGIFTSIEYRRDMDVVMVFTHFTLPSTNIESKSPFDLVYKAALYYRATNSFCGFVELKDVNGKLMPLLRTEVNNPDHYPDHYRLNQAIRDLTKGANMGTPLPNAITGETGLSGAFILKKYYKIEKPGEYFLTVWPKIYKRSDEDHDLLERIDLSSVTLAIKWNG